MNTVREIGKLNEEELRMGVGDSMSWHAAHQNNAWVYVGGLAFELTEGDIVCAFSQWGEIEDVHLVRDDATGRSRGFAFIKFEDWRSTTLAVDNMTGALLLGRTVRVDHTDYRPPAPPKLDEHHPSHAERPAPQEYRPGHAYTGKGTATSYSATRGQDLFAQNNRSQQWHEGAANQPKAIESSAHDARHLQPHLSEGGHSQALKMNEHLGKDRKAGMSTGHSAPLNWKGRGR